jgi:hypothetical protein
MDEMIPCQVLELSDGSMPAFLSVSSNFQISVTFPQHTPKSLTVALAQMLSGKGAGHTIIGCRMTSGGMLKCSKFGDDAPE